MRHVSASVSVARERGGNAKVVVVQMEGGRAERTDKRF
jgi:hypothetical protein